ncbi:MAG TPA: galactose oxidase early set domain-containing protein [Acidimicrobiia bacterium]|nr:galactose oxidase early set domain-containing protein [Acidimicrobiia bacterium]
MGRHRRGVIAVASLALALITVGPVSAGTGQQVANPQSPEVSGSPAEIGQWSHPFEEGGAQTPRCQRRDGLLKDEIFCKVAAVTTAMLPDGRIFYANGIEADENVRYHYELELGNRTRADRTRVLDLRGAEPVWTTPPQEFGASWNPQVKPGQNWMNGDPFGVVGTPGRPGDGFVGSKWGKLGGPPQQPSSPPDDKPYSERSTFCADAAQLPDGRILMAGGTDYYNEPSLADRDEGAPADVGLLELEGLRAAWIFDPKTDKHHAMAPMKYGRWYPSLVTLPDGKVTVFSGVTKLLKSTQLGQVRRTETFDPATGTWTENYVGDESETALPLFSRLNLMANGKILFNGVGQNFGPNGTDAEEATFNFQKMYDPATKKWEIVGPALLGSRGSASQVMLPIKAPYNETSIITFGGTLGIPPGAALATNFSTVTTVTKDGKVTNRMTKGQLNNRRWFHDGTILPDGTILATNGGDKDSLQMPGYEVAVRQAEIYDPATDTWKPVASAARDRHYHETATLLPDGRVLSGGMSSVATMYGHRRDQAYGVFANNEKDSSFELYSPPYLFRGDRPEIEFAPSGVAWGSQFDVRMKGSDEVASIALIRTGSPQHGLDTDIRSIELEFKQDGNKLTVAAPPNGVIAPPGYYMLFVNKKSPKGPIPSVAAMVRVADLVSAQSLADTPALIPMKDSSIPAATGSATPDEDSSMNDFGECTGCSKGERGGLRSELQQSNPALQQLPISSEDDDHIQQTASRPPQSSTAWTRLRPVRPTFVG